jgi:hypothetical protein
MLIDIVIFWKNFYVAAGRSTGVFEAEFVVSAR